MSETETQTQTQNQTQRIWSECDSAKTSIDKRRNKQEWRHSKIRK